MGESLNVRRCHVCGDLNESCNEILKCAACGKSLLPFYYFDKKKMAELADNALRPEEGVGNTYGPIRGLTAYW